MTKTFGQIIDALTPNTWYVCPDLVSAKKVSKGMHVTMGVPQDMTMDFIQNKKRAILLIVNVEDLEKAKK